MLRIGVLELRTAAEDRLCLPTRGRVEHAARESQQASRTEFSDQESCLHGASARAIASIGLEHALGMTGAQLGNRLRDRLEAGAIAPALGAIVEQRIHVF